MSSLRHRRPAARFLTGILQLAVLVAAGCDDPPTAAPATAPPFAFCGAWLAPRGGVPLDSPGGDRVVRRMRGAGVRWVAVGHDVVMPKLAEPRLEFGQGDEALRGALRRIAAAGLRTFLLPRIESPEFFAPPYPFRADIDFAAPGDWQRFHRDLQRMVLHYARLAREEGVGLFGLGLELKHSVRKHPAFWRQLIAKVRGIYRGGLTYSANWYDEWRDITFWSDLDYIGVGAYFELPPRDGGEGGGAGGEGLVGRWQGTLAELAAVSARHRRPVLFTEVGYTGFYDCAERPWEWAGKAARGVAVDHRAQARALAALFRVVAAEERIAGLFVWSFYTDPGHTEAWEYAVQGRPAETELRRAYGALR